jgi:hypothetical protein
MSELTEILSADWDDGHHICAGVIAAELPRQRKPALPKYPSHLGRRLRDIVTCDVANVSAARGR